MNLGRKSFLMLTGLLFVVKGYAQPIDPDKLIKVTPENDPKCVEYYIYDGATYCSTEKTDTKPVDPKVKDYEKLNIVFDDRPWRIGWGNEDKTGTTVEYVTNGEMIENWNELVTSQFFPGLQNKASLKEFSDLFIDNFKKGGFDPIVTFHEESDDRVIFEIQVQKPKNQIQDILELIMKDDQGVYVLQYAVKKLDMGKELRDKWVQNFKDTEIKE